MMAENEADQRSVYGDDIVKVKEEMIAENEAEIHSLCGDVSVKVQDEIKPKTEYQTTSHSPFDDVSVKVKEEIQNENQTTPHSPFDDVSVKVEDKIKAEISSKTSLQMTPSQELYHVNQCHPGFVTSCDDASLYIGTGSQINLGVVESQQVILENNNVGHWRTSLEEGINEVDADESPQHPVEWKMSVEEIEDYLGISKQISTCHKASDKEESNEVSHLGTSLEEESESVKTVVDESAKNSDERQISVEEIEDYCDTAENISTKQNISDKDCGSIKYTESISSEPKMSLYYTTICIQRKIVKNIIQYKCLFCGKTFSHKSPLITHITSHTGEKPFPCPTCGKSFSQRSSLSNHVKIHTGEKPFNTMTHTGEKPLKCPICGRLISEKSYLAHLRIHTGEKPFSCPTCGKSFSQRSTLFNHVKIHTGERPFKCLACGKSFSWKSSLRLHIMTHTRKQDEVVGLPWQIHWDPHKVKIG